MQYHQPSLFSIILLTLHLYRHSTGAAPAATNLRSTGETSSAVVQTQDDRKSYYSDYPNLDNMKRLQSYITATFRDVSSGPADLALAVALWDQNFDNREEACAAVESTVANNVGEQSESESCQPTYRCDYDKGRWPSTLIDVNCSYHPCRATSYNSPARDTCWGPQQTIPIVKFQQETQQASLDAMAESSESEDTKIEMSGKWAIETFPLTTVCFCSAK